MADIVGGYLGERRVTLTADGSIQSIRYLVADLDDLGDDIKKAMLTPGSDLYFKGPFDPTPRHYRVVSAQDQEEGWKQIDVEPIGG